MQLKNGFSQDGIFRGTLLLDKVYVVPLTGLIFSPTHDKRPMTNDYIMTNEETLDVFFSQRPSIKFGGFFMD